MTMRHIRITYPLAKTALSFDYQISDTAADEFERTFHEWAPEAVIAVDDCVTDELPVIPCAQLWEP